MVQVLTTMMPPRTTAAVDLPHTSQNCNAFSRVSSRSSSPAGHCIQPFVSPIFTLTSVAASLQLAGGRQGANLPPHHFLSNLLSSPLTPSGQRRAGQRLLGHGRGRLARFGHFSIGFGLEPIPIKDDDAPPAHCDQSLIL